MNSHRTMPLLAVAWLLASTAARLRPGRRSVDAGRACRLVRHTPARAAPAKPEASTPRPHHPAAKSLPADAEQIDPAAERDASLERRRKAFFANKPDDRQPDGDGSSAPVGVTPRRERRPDAGNGPEVLSQAVTSRTAGSSDPCGLPCKTIPYCGNISHKDEEVGPVREDHRCALRVSLVHDLGRCPRTRRTAQLAQLVRQGDDLMARALAIAQTKPATRSQVDNVTGRLGATMGRG